MDPGVREVEAARVADALAQRDRPAVLEQRDSGSGSVRDRVVDVPDFLVEDVTVLERSRSLDRCELGLLLAGCAEADQRTDDGAERLGLLRGEVAPQELLHVAVGVLAHEQEVDQANVVVLAKPVELGEDLALDLSAFEADHQQLNRSDRHLALLSIAQAGVASQTRTPLRSEHF